MLILGILILIIFSAIGVILITKGVRLGDQTDSYNATGKTYTVFGIFLLIFAFALSIFCFAKNEQFKNDAGYHNEQHHHDYSDDNTDNSDDNTDNSDDNDYTPDYSGSFTNKYGSRTTKCAVSGCNNYIASSGDTNCCVTHSNKCGNCRCYIDGDAMYCMSCISGSISGGGSSSGSGHACYVCGESAHSKYGSYYYCPDCLAMVKAFS